MTQISESHRLARLLQSVSTESEVAKVLEALLTPKELIELNTRIDIFILLRQRVPHHQIAHQLGVGVATVTRGSKELKKGTLTGVKLQ